MYTDEEKKECLVSMGEAMQILGVKWSFWVIGELANAPLRFNELRRNLKGISTKSLSDVLRRLEQARIVHREVFPTVPVTVEYSLTDKGTDFLRVYSAMHDWGEKWTGPDHY
ncbi:helix-turn-helix domain-containing protein [Paenibacillus sp. XY044]|uniref:winged helix-turn-helix transcriptional regulator n=1 Tax=Paenibacillus sp. XY044 TaxID=2026089 RepID=UPI000B98F451|nr:helix-turn-helix domain-containing protein [Paenibacillus sp. XY044]OZB91271.1 transcriptional regulator [Paenibacillus sp. XY044]